jgi:polysaccharide export outer membrane protein
MTPYDWSKAMRRSRALLAVEMALCLCLCFATSAAPQQSVNATITPVPISTATVGTVPSYQLGPDDVIAIKALNADEISSASMRIDPSGYISLPMLGRLTAGGLTVEGLEKELNARLRTYVKEPGVAVTIVEYRSQPVSVIGSVNQPGVHQLEGRKTLVEILAKAGGLRPEAGNVIKITRRTEIGQIPLASATKDANGQFSIAQVSLRGIMQATHPEENILIQPNDVISVPRADLVYVIGEVKKPGGFILYERGSILSLQALAMAEGFTSTASPQRAVILRQSTPDAKRVEISANLKEILSGKRSDVELLPEDILFVPNNAAKSALSGGLRTAVSAAASAIIYRGFY